MNENYQFKATIGLDWADQKHDLWIRPADGSKSEHLRLEQSPEALHEWAAKLRKRFDTGQVALGVETSRGPVISALMPYDFVVLCPINPKALKDYRAAFSVSGAKNDRTDAQLIEEFIRLHSEKLKALQPDTELTRKLSSFVQDRRHLVDERTRIVNQLHSKLKTYYPLAETLIGSQSDIILAAEFLSRWPDLESLVAATAPKIRAFFYQHNSRSAKKMEQRLEPARELVLALAGMLKCLHKSVARLEEAIELAMDQHPDAPIFRSLPGAGPALAPRLLVAFGTQRDRFETAQEVAQFYGVAPVVIQRGNSELVRLRRRCPKFGRQTFHENARCASKTEPWGRAYYEQQKKKHDDKHHQACRALAYKLIRIYFACWKTRTEYKSNTYLDALQKHGSPLHNKLNMIGE